jgi:SHAQKYF class myb-like DNA-binding protein
MSSNAPKFKSGKLSNRKKIFKVENAKSIQAPKFKPHFYTNKNLFLVRNMQKNSANLHKKKLKANFINKKRNALSRRELKYKRRLFITNHSKPVINSTPNKNESTPKKIIKLKKKLNLKFSVVNHNKIHDKKKDKIINKNIIDANNEISSNENNINSNIINGEENIDSNLCNLFWNNSPEKKPKIINYKNGKYTSGRWHLDEHKKFIEAIIKYGNDWKEVQKYIGTRSSSQARSHAQKFFIKLKQDQAKSKLSNMIDYSNSSIRTFHEALQSLPPDKKQKIIQELENVVFDRRISNKKRKRNSKSNGGNNISETITEMELISGTDFFEDEDFDLDENKNDNNGNNNQEMKKIRLEKRKMSIDSLNEEKKIDKRKFINEIENNNGVFSDEEYEKSFHKVFSDKEGKDIEQESRSQSLDDDFMFNIKI